MVGHAVPFRKGGLVRVVCICMNAADVIDSASRTRPHLFASSLVHVNGFGVALDFAPCRLPRWKPR